MIRKERQERGMNSHEEHPQYNKKGQNIKNVSFSPTQIFQSTTTFRMHAKVLSTHVIHGDHVKI